MEGIPSNTVSLRGAAQSGASSSAIVLATVNGRYSHSAFGLRWLYANLGEFKADCTICEFYLGQPATLIAETILRFAPKVVGFGLYIWNAAVLTEAIQIVKRVRPATTIVVGGPEAGYEYEDQAWYPYADYVVRGEGEDAFYQIVRSVLAGAAPKTKVVLAPSPDLATLESPYEVYTAEDIAHRTIYVEASRGCPFQCEFCMSSLDSHVREYPLGPFLASMEELIKRGARHFKFVDRTFNLKTERVGRILEFFRRHWHEGMQLHFEIVPDRLSEETLALMAGFPAGGLHLEIGVQTFNPASQAAISRRQDLDKTRRALEYLRNETGALLHADLVVGLPHETWQSLREGFDDLFALRPHEIQVGILKRLRGAPIARHEEPCGMVFSKAPPYEILQTHTLSFGELQRLKRFARYFDVFSNSDKFPGSLALLWEDAVSPFDVFMALSDRVWAETGRTHQIALKEQARLLYEHLARCGRDRREIASAILSDCDRIPGRHAVLNFLDPQIGR